LKKVSDTEKKDRSAAAVPGAEPAGGASGGASGAATPGDAGLAGALASALAARKSKVSHSGKYKHFSWIGQILTCLQTMNPTKMIGKSVEFRRSDKSTSQANHDLIPTPRNLRHPVSRYEDVERVMRTCIWVTHSGGSAKINLKRRTTWLISVRVLVDTKNDKVYSSSSKPSSSPLGHRLMPYEFPCLRKSNHHILDPLDFISTSRQQRNL